MPEKLRSAPVRYGLALASLVVLMTVSTVLEKVLPFRIDFTSFVIIAMIASAWYFGLGPGLMLAIILELTIDYFSRPPFAFKTAVIVFNRMVLFTSVVWFASSRRKVEQELRAQRELLEESLQREQLARQQAAGFRSTQGRISCDRLSRVAHSLERDTWLGGNVEYGRA